MNALNELLKRDRPEIVYHYTSFAGFKGIVEGKSIWATDIRFLNDVKEFNHGLDLAEKIVEDASDGVVRFLATQMFKEIRQSDIFVGRGLQVCVSSFSKEADLLSQWRGYCPDGRGVCIGFRPDFVSSYVGNGSYSVFAPCEYDEEKQKEIVSEATYDLIEMARDAVKMGFPAEESRDIAKLTNIDESDEPEEANRLRQEITNRFSSKYKDVGPDLFRKLFLASALLKDKAFKEEVEWRLVLPALSNAKKFGPYEWQFRASKSSLIPYIPVSIKTQKGNIEITEVIVGPSPDKDLAMRSVERFLEAEEIDGAVVRSSSIPYKNW